MIEAADIIAGDPAQSEQRLAMWAAVLHQVHRAGLAAPQREELTEHLCAHRAPDLQNVADMDRMPEAPQVAAGQGAGSGMGEILHSIGLAHALDPTPLSGQRSTARLHLGNLLPYAGVGKPPHSRPIRAGHRILIFDWRCENEGLCGRVLLRLRQSYGAPRPRTASTSCATRRSCASSAITS